ncbi:MAG TPA: exostosin family protein [Acidobacteriaceae bacterium]|nr:exostosin family protein [Acidobacteriaceae bacterium]
MAKVLVLSSAVDVPLDPWKQSSAFLLKHSAEMDSFGVHRLTEDPEEADIILFAEMGACGKFAEVVRAHPYYKRFAEKCFLFDSSDMFFPVLPGIYASLTKGWYLPHRTRTGFYLYLIENAFVTHRPYTGKEPYLASFVGSKVTHPLRGHLFLFGRDDIYVKDTSSYSSRTTYHGEPAERAQFWSEYADSLANAKFSLCPRGRGTGSIRLFESMKMGRACVILSDAWQPNDGIDWSEFAIIVPEREVGRVPEILDQNAHRAPEMGARARQVWEEYFSERVRFHRMVELCLDMRRHGRSSRFTNRMRLLRQIAAPGNFRWYLSTKKDLYRNKGRIYW